MKRELYPSEKNNVNVKIRREIRDELKIFCVTRKINMVDLLSDLAKKEMERVIKKEEKQAENS